MTRTTADKIIELLSKGLTITLVALIPLTALAMLKLLFFGLD